MNMRKWLTAMSAAALLAMGVMASPQAAAAPAEPAGKNIDVCICLDVSGSMNGLIDSAKTKLWAIVNDLAKVKPTPNLRVALYSYGHDRYDKARGWVKLDQEFTTDLDLVYQKLNALTISGGTELVARVCNYAIDELKWTEDKKALKMIFVCGNEPADQDKEIKLEDVAQKALKKDIIINTIYCEYRQPQEAKLWKEFADMAEGKFASIDQNKGTVVVATPHDKELADLSAKLNNTYIAYGKDGKAKAENQKEQDKNAAQAGAPAAADRALSKGGGLYRNAHWDLVDKIKEDPNFDITKIPEDELCDELKKMKPEERVKFVKDKLAEREALQKQIAELGKKRNEYIAEEMRKNPSQADKAFDEAVRKALREQAGKKGIEIPD